MNNQFLLIFDNIEQMLNLVSNYKCVHVVIDESVDLIMQQKLFNTLNNRVQTIKTIISPCYATENLANSLVFRGEDFVIGVGKLHLQSVVKYYSYANQLNYAVFPVKEIAEYSFSKYAFIQDDKFCFYMCNKPAFAFINREYFSQDDIFKLEKVLSYKNIVLYEKEFETTILGKNNFDVSNIVKSINLCDGSYKSVIKLYASASMLLESSKTSQFLGCEYVMLSLLNLNKKDISLNLINSTNLLTRFYECFNKFKLIRITPNYNKHLLALKKEYGFCLSQTSPLVLNCFTNKELHKMEYTLNAYQPHLKNMFNNCKSNFMFSNVTFLSRELELALALSPSITANKSILSFVRDFGYFEN